jgi:hypothetical protein
MRWWPIPAHSAVLLTAVLGAAAPAAPAAAQQSLEVHVALRGGILTPADWLFEEYVDFGKEMLEWTQGAVLRAPVAGAAAELRLEPAGAWLRVELLRTRGAETSLTHAFLRPLQGFEPPRVERAYYRAPTTLTFASAELGFPTRLRLPRGIQPFAAVGGGAKWYAFGDPRLPAEAGQVIMPAPGMELFLQLGGGAAVPLGPARAELLVRDAIGYYWGRQQHDVMVLAGLSFRVR